MLATLHRKPFSNKDWIYECKFDGIRALIYCDNGQCRIMSRNKIDITKNYPEISKACHKLNIKNFILDGEIVAFKGDVSSFTTLQQRMHIRTAKLRKQKIPVFFYAFDLIYFEGFYLEKLPLVRRKEILKAAFNFQTPLIYTEHLEKEGIQYFQAACKQGWEGIMAKEATSSYAHGRSKQWLKFKCIQKQEFVIGGFTAPKGARFGFGALLIGYYVGKVLKYAGKVGTGYTHQLLKELYAKLLTLQSACIPFGEYIPEKNVTWIKPQLVADIRFTEWTRDGKLRHPSFEGLRIDKPANEVIREFAEDSDEK